MQTRQAPPSTTPGSAPTPGTPGSPGSPPGNTLARNLAALALRNPDLARRLQDTSPRSDIEFLDTPEGVATAVLDGRALASKRRPLEEASRLAESVDPAEAAVLAIPGFGAGWHVRAVAERIGRTGVVLVLEPDLTLLRAVLERIDHSAWLATTNVAIFEHEEDRASIARALESFEALVALGVKIVEHAPNSQRLGDAVARFGQSLTGVVAAIRTNVVTTMVQTETTVRNALMNLDRYVASPGVKDLEGLFADKPAVVVSAGPSLHRNIAQLAAPGVRDRVLIVATQTTLKPLLAAGVKPHFVVALDYHEISRRFYEGLTAADVDGVTLVAEPKANPAILEAWPGMLRCPRDAFLDVLLSQHADENKGRLKSGATVAHLAYYLARHTGANPVALIGQDLGFTDGQYYAAGAAIHEVWACELNEFTTLELREWQRIMRGRGTLHRAQDHLGRPVYTDEQMATYLAQFERDFAADEAKGLTTIDATEGGVRKRHAEAMPLAEFLASHAPAHAQPLAPIPPASWPAGAPSLKSLREHAQRVRREVWSVGKVSRRTETTLAQMLEHQQDQQRVGRLIGETERLEKEVRSYDPAYTLVQRFNQTGGFNRLRADRAIQLASHDPMARQRAQIERDIANVRWIADAADSLGALLDGCLRAFDGGPKLTRDITAPGRAGEKCAAAGASVTTRVAACIVVDTANGLFGQARDLARPVLGRNPLRRTLERLAACRRLDQAVLLTTDAEATRGILGGDIHGLRVEIQELPELRASRARSVRAARAFSRACWRGGLADLTVYDELLDPEMLSKALDRAGCNAALLVGADWLLVDPALCEEVIARHSEDPERHRVAFTQAPPGLAGAVVSRALLDELAAAEAQGAGALATLGSLFAYTPRRSKPDPIGSSLCAQIDPRVRNARGRFVLDSDAHAAWMERLLTRLDANADATAIAEAFDRVIAEGVAPPPSEIVLDIGGASPFASPPADWLGERLRRARDPRPIENLVRLLRDALAQAPGAAVTMTAAGETLTHPHLPRLIEHARSLGAAAVHVRTFLRASDEHITATLAAAPDIVSVDLLADTAQTYQDITGEADFDAVRAALARVIDARTHDGFAPSPWIVPRLTRCDATYRDIEPFVDRWTLALGHASIDPMPQAGFAGRIQPLPLPKVADAAHRRETLRTGDKA